MYNLTTLKNGLTLITIDLPHLESVTSMVAVGAGSRYEGRKNNGISHFLEHMFFKGSKKYPSTEQIATLIDGVGAVQNAATSKEYTFYFIKSAAEHIELANDILSSMLKESLLSPEEVEREKGVIIEEIRMYQDDPKRYIWDLYELLQFGDQPLGWFVTGEEKNIKSMTREDFISYMGSLYVPENMCLILAGKLPKDPVALAQKYYSGLKDGSFGKFQPYQIEKQTKPRVNIYYKKTDQANLVLGVQAYDRRDPKKYATRVLSLILGEGMSSRLFLQVRERRGLAYHVMSAYEPYIDTGSFVTYAGLKLEKIEEGLKVIKDEMEKFKSEKVSADELKKAKDMEKGRMALRSESTNFLAEYYGLDFVLDREVETIDEYLKHIDKVTAEDVMMVAQELFQKEKLNLQIIAPLEDTSPFEKILNS